ncbi:MAG: hypothetical protein ACLQDV_17020, partial [Candidatus Binataceae bacterium]
RMGCWFPTSEPSKHLPRAKRKTAAFSSSNPIRANSLRPRANQDLASFSRGPVLRKHNYLRTPSLSKERAMILCGASDEIRFPVPA